MKSIQIDDLTYEQLLARKRRDGLTIRWQVSQAIRFFLRRNTHKSVTPAAEK